MKILILTKDNFKPAEEIERFLSKEGHQVSSTTAKQFLNDGKFFDLGISIHYKYILSKDQIESFDLGVLNIHPSFLPLGRGSDPVIWSIINNDPSGVSIHWMDEGIDTGNVMVRHQVDRQALETGEALYNRIVAGYEPLFRVFWSDFVTSLMFGNFPSGTPQSQLETNEARSYKAKKRQDLIEVGNLRSSYAKFRPIKNMLALTHSEHNNMFLIGDDGEEYTVKLTLEKRN